MRIFAQETKTFVCRKHTSLVPAHTPTIIYTAWNAYYAGSMHPFDRLEREAVFELATVCTFVFLAFFLYIYIIAVCSRLWSLHIPRYIQIITYPSWQIYWCGSRWFCVPCRRCAHVFGMYGKKLHLFWAHWKSMEHIAYPIFQLSGFFL